MAPARPGLRLPRARRLRASRDFSELRQAGQRLVVGCLIANWQALPAGGSSRVGVVTSRRIGGAVLRNRARRLLREAFRLHQHDLTQPVAAVLVARPSIAGKALAEVEHDFLSAMRRARLLSAP